MISHVIVYKDQSMLNVAYLLAKKNLKVRKKLHKLFLIVLLYIICVV